MLPRNGGVTANAGATLINGGALSPFHLCQETVGAHALPMQFFYKNLTIILIETESEDGFKSISNFMCKPIQK